MPGRRDELLSTVQEGRGVERHSVIQRLCDLGVHSSCEPDSHLSTSPFSILGCEPGLEMA